MVAITGASGSVYAKNLIERLHSMVCPTGEVGIIVSSSGKQVWEYELKEELPSGDCIRYYSNDDFFAPPASGSAGYDGMVIIPCTMGTLGRIANGTSNELIGRAADVMLKERKPTVLVAREAPYSLIHIENMRSVTLAGGIILPASPSFYSHPKSIDELVDTITDRVLGMLGFDADGYRWGGGRSCEL